MRGRVWSFSNASLTSIVVSGGVATVTTGSAHGLSTGAVAFQVYGSSFSPGTSVATITVTDTTHFTFTSGKPDGTYTTGMVIAEFGTINLGSHYSTGAYGANINIGGVITPLADRVESGTPVAYAAFTDAVAAFKSAGVDKVRWSSNQFKIASDQVFGFRDNVNATSGATDASLSRIAAKGIGLGSGAAASVDGYAQAAGYMANGGTKFTASGCSNSTTVGGATAGKFSSGTTGACTVVITMNGATGLTAPTGWACSASDLTTPANLMSQSASSTTTATITGTTVSGDVISFSCIGY